MSGVQKVWFNHATLVFSVNRILCNHVKSRANFVVTNDAQRCHKDNLRRRYWRQCWHHGNSWWRHQMETFSALLVIGAGNSPVPGEFPAQRPVTRGFDVFFDLRLNKQLSEQWWGLWFEAPSPPLWRHRNVLFLSDLPPISQAANRICLPWSCCPTKYMERSTEDDGMATCGPIQYKMCVCVTITFS